MKTPEPEYPQLPEDMVRGKAPRPARGDLVSPPQEMPRLVARTEDSPDAPLDPLDRLLGWRSPKVPMPILPVPHRPEGVAQKVERLAPPFAHPGLLLIERQPHLAK